MKTTLTAITTASLIAANANAVPVTSGLIQDLDAEVGVTTSGTDVTAWVNQGSAGDDVTSGTGGAQLVASATPGGQAAVRFTNDRLVGDDAAAFDSIVQGSGLTWIAVINPGAQAGSDNPGKNAIFGTLENSSGFNGYVGGIDNAESVYGLERANSGADERTTGATTGLDAGWVIVVGRVAAGTGSVLQEVFVNSATADGSSNITIGAAGEADLLAIGAERAGGAAPEYYDGDLARLLIYNRPLTDQELDQVGFDLATTYGISTTFVLEPSSLALLGLGGLLIARRRRA